MACTVTSTQAEHSYRLVTTYITDPASDTILMNTRLQALPGSGANLARLHLYARLDAHVNGNGGGGSDNAGANSGVVDPSGVPVVFSTNTVTNAANRDYAVPTYMALAGTSAQAASVGYAGTASDGLNKLDATHALTPYTSAPDGHVVATENVTPGGSHEVTLALGFGRTQAQSVSVAKGSLRRPFGQTAASYLRGWVSYDAGLRPPPAREARLAGRYYLSANVLKAHRGVHAERHRVLPVRQRRREGQRGRVRRLLPAEPVLVPGHWRAMGADRGRHRAPVAEPVR
jgi:glucoamylase